MFLGRAICKNIYWNRNKQDFFSRFCLNDARGSNSQLKLALRICKGKVKRKSYQWPVCHFPTFFLVTARDLEFFTFKKNWRTRWAWCYRSMYVYCNFLIDLLELRAVNKGSNVFCLCLWKVWLASAKTVLLHCFYKTNSRICQHYKYFRKKASMI